VVCARLAGQMDSDRVDDEPRPLDGRRPVALGGDGAVGDNVTFVHLTLLIVDGAIVVGTGDCPDEAAAGSQIQLDVPVTVTLTEVEAVAVDLSAPLFRHEAVMAAHDDPLLLCEPRLEFGFGGLLGGGDPPAFW